MAIEMEVKGGYVKSGRKIAIPAYFYLLSFLLPALISFFFFSETRSLNTFTAIFGYTRNPVLPYDTYAVSFSDDIPEQLRESIEKSVSEMELDGKKRFSFVDDGKLKIGYSDKQDSSSIYTSYLLPVSHFYAIRDGLNREDLSGEIYVSEYLHSNLGSFLEKLLPESNVKGISGDTFASLDDEGEKFSLIDLSELDYKMKLLELGGVYFLDDHEGGIQYSLSITEGSDGHIADILRKRLLSSSNHDFDRENVAKLNMTGVTAITRGLAGKVDASGRMGYPAEKISEFLKDADLVHISNEVSFVPGCAPSDGMRFCSRPEYIKALEDIGTNIVSLTGNHNNDYGSQYNLASLEMYEERGWDYYGGGKNSEDASKILYKEVHGTTIAFLGYNYYDTMLGTFALAGNTRAGSNSYSEAKMREDIKKAKENSDVVIVDFQFQECYSYPEIGAYMPFCYKPLTSPDQKGVFRKAVEFGADVVVGVQAHQPQTYEIYNGKLIFYGLGNIFFDQILWPGTRHGLVLTHYLYEGRLLQSKITTTDYDRDMQPFVTEGVQREQLLNFLSDAR